jgi:hypothetical protein
MALPGAACIEVITGLRQVQRSILLHNNDCNDVMPELILRAEGWGINPHPFLFFAGRSP